MSNEFDPDKWYEQELDADKYLSENGMSGTPTIVEEMSPGISTLERAAIKNLSEESSPDALSWLKSRHPDLDIQHHSGRIIARKPGEAQFRVLDPNTGMFSKDIGQDLLDGAYPFVAGTAEGAATTAGATVGGPVGAIAAGAAAGAGTEGLKQALARYIGLSKEFNPKDIAVNATMSGALPIVGKLAKGTYSVGKQKLFPLAGEYTSGVPSNVIKTTMNRLPELDQMEKGFMFDFSQAAKDKVSDRLFKAIELEGTKLAESLAAAGVKVPVGPAVEPLEGALSNLKRIQSELPTPEIQREINAVQRIIDRNFKTQPSSVKTTKFTPTPDPDGKGSLNPLTLLWEPNTTMKRTVGKVDVPARPIQEVPADIAWELQKRIGSQAQYSKLPPTSQFVSPRFMNDTVRAFDDSYASLGESLGKATSGVSVESKNNLSDVYDLKAELQPYFGTPKATYQTLTNLETKSGLIPKELLEKAKQMTGVDVMPEAELLRAQSILGDKRPGGIPMFPVSSQGSTSTSRSNALRTIGGVAGGGIGNELADKKGAWLGALMGTTAGATIGGPRAIKKYIRLMDAAEQKALDPRYQLLGATLPRTAWHLLYKPNKTKTEQSE